MTTLAPTDAQARQVQPSDYPMPQTARSDLQSIAERLRWLANEPDATEGMASTVTWRQKLDDAERLSAIARALPYYRHVTPAALEAARRILSGKDENGRQNVDYGPSAEAVARELLRIGGET